MLYPSYGQATMLHYNIIILLHYYTHTTTRQHTPTHTRICIESKVRNKETFTNKTFTNKQ